MQQVFRTTTSASSSEPGSMPSAASRPAMRSESCSFIWHPKVRTWNRRVTAAQCTGAPAGAGKEIDRSDRCRGWAAGAAPHRRRTGTSSALLDLEVDQVVGDLERV